MALTKQQRDRLERTEFWQNAVANMGTFEIPEGYEAAGKKDKYERFTGFLKEWLINLIIIPKQFNETKDDNHPDKEKFMKTIYLFCNHDIQKSQKNAFWKELIEVGSGKKDLVDSTLNYATFLKPLKNPTNEDLQPIYDMFMPTYHAIKEKFEKRWWFEWIFNHKQYVAERDSLKAMDGLFHELTGFGKFVAEEQLDKFKNELQEMRTINNEEIENVNVAHLNGSIPLNVEEANEEMNRNMVGEVEEQLINRNVIKK